MKKSVKIFGVLVLILVLVGISEFLHDKKTLQNDIIRLHVVGNSNTDYDQAVKFTVKDGIVAWLQENMQDVNSAADAVEYLSGKMSELERLANEILTENHASYKATVSLKNEAFDTRYYDTFALPAGVYQSLRVEIGEASGRNWWCVVFPSLCIPTSSAQFCQTAVSSGMDNDLAQTLSGDEEFEIRFFILDVFGKIENLFLFP